MTENRNLEFFRKELDKLDGAIVIMLAERFRITREVGKFKKKHNLPPLDKAREEAIYKKLRQKAIEKNLDPQMLEDVWKVLMSQSKKEHGEIKN